MTGVADWKDDRFAAVQWILMLVFAWSLILSIAVVQTVAVLMTLVWLVHWAMKKRTFRRTPFDLPLLAFVTARLLSIPFSSHPSLSVETLWKEIVYYPLFFVVTQELRLDKKNVRWLLWSFVGAGMLATVYGATMYFTGQQIRAASTVSGPVTFGMYLTALVSMILIVGRNREIVPKVWMWLTAAGVLILGIIATLNRIHWGIMTLMTGLIGLIRERRLLVVLAVGGVIAVVSPPVWQRITESFDSVGEFMNGRDIIWMNALEHADERPFTGHGPRTFHEVFTARDVIRDKEVGSWHNDYLQVYMESGILGLGAFVWLMVLVFRRGFAAWKTLRKDPFWGDLVLALLFAMVAFYLSGLVGGFVIDPLNSMFHRFLLGVLALVIAESAAGRGSPAAAS